MDDPSKRRNVRFKLFENTPEACLRAHFEFKIIFLKL